MSNINLNTNNFRRNVEDTIKNRLMAIGWAMVRDIKKSMKGYGEYSRIDTRQVVKGSLRQQGKNKKYHYPSPPGGVPAVDSGRLRASITMNWADGLSGGLSSLSRAPIENPAPNSEPDDGVGEPSPKANEFIVVVGTNVVYGEYLELGTSKMSPRPFLRPVLEKL